MVAETVKILCGRSGSVFISHGLVGLRSATRSSKTTSRDRRRAPDDATVLPGRRARSRRDREPRRTAGAAARAPEGGAAPRVRPCRALPAAASMRRACIRGRPEDACRSGARACGNARRDRARRCTSQVMRRRVPNAGCRMPNAGCRMPDAGCKARAERHEAQRAGPHARSLRSDRLAGAGAPRSARRRVGCAASAKRLPASGG